MPISEANAISWLDVIFVARFKDCHHQVMTHVQLTNATTA